MMLSVLGIITSILPQQAPCAGGINVTIHGTHLCRNDTDAVLLGGAAATVLEQSPVMIVVRAASCVVSGTGNVTVISRSLGSTVSVDGFRYNPGTHIF